MLNPSHRVVGWSGVCRRRLVVGWFCFVLVCCGVLEATSVESMHRIKLQKGVKQWMPLHGRSHRSRELLRGGTPRMRLRLEVAGPNANSLAGESVPLTGLCRLIFAERLD